MPNLIRQRELLRMEYEYEKAEFRRAAETMGVERKVRRGECWFPVTIGRSYYNSLDRLVVEITRTADDDIEHNFEHGRPVCFFTQDGSGGLHYLDFQGTVSYAEPTRMVVALPGEGALARLAQLERPGVQLHFDETTYRLMFEALERTIAARDGRVAHLREVVHGGLRPAFAAPPAVAPRYPWLNASQEAAVSQVLRARDVMVVHGPPGTGKTTTLVEAVCEVLRREEQVLVCAQSNTAVDWIAEQLADRGLSVLRVGNPTRVSGRLLSHTYERRFEAHPDYPALWQVRRDLRRLRALPRRERGEAHHQKVARLQDKADALELRIRQALFDASRVVAATLAGTAAAVMAGRHFHTLFIDEAAQALEAACWIALQRADRVVLAGDHCQLPPTVKCHEAARAGLGHTLMEQVVKAHPGAVSLLTVQYRMSEALMRFSSEWFYGGALTAAPEVRQRGLLDAMDHPLVWIDSGATGADDGGESYVAASCGRVNKAEARLLLRALRAYVARVGRHRLLEERADVGIISPYKAQVQYLRALLRADDFLRPLRRSVSVNTVDAFQGQERDVIVLSLVRDNAAGQIGFLSDLRRMNVAITRARTKLIIIGSAATLGRHRFYRTLMERCHHEALPGDEEALPDDGEAPADA